MSPAPAPPVISAREHAPAPPPGTRPAAPARDLAGGPARVLRCAACGRAIADPRERTAVQGAHEHVFVNPAGHDYQIRLYHQAPGACPIGPATGFFSWFPGYVWRVLVCGACGVHLGWVYGEPPAFVGLIAERLVEEPDA